MSERACRKCGCTLHRACVLAKPDYPTEYCMWTASEGTLCTACVDGADPDWQHPPHLWSTAIATGARSRLPDHRTAIFEEADDA